MGRGDLLVYMLTCWHFLFLSVRSKSSNITRSNWVVKLKVCLPRKDNYHFFLTSYVGKDIYLWALGGARGILGVKVGVEEKKKEGKK